MKNEEDLNCKVLIICEGNLDLKVLSKVISDNKIHNCKVITTTLKNGGGIDKLGEKLNLVKLNEDFLQNVEHVLVVGDNDNVGAEARLKKQIQIASKSTPPGGRVTVDFLEHPPKNKTISFTLLPKNSFGCIETILVERFFNKWPSLRSPVESFKTSMPSVSWSEPQSSKMRLECIVASTCDQMPDVAVWNHWQKKYDYHVPIDGTDFEDLASYIKQLATE
jgi:hypothetical protein